MEAGWRLEYCATAENSTYCPDNFDEFFKQRRRWTPSTLANQVVVINQQTRIRENNDFINIFFIFYQAVLMISSIIGYVHLLCLIREMDMSMPSLLRSLCKSYITVYVKLVVFESEFFLIIED